MTDRKTEMMLIPGLSCALCGAEGTPGVNVPVFRAVDNVPAYPRVCQGCLSSLLGFVLQMLGHHSAQVAAIAASVQTDT